jgi:hypothetical protein
MHTGSLMFEEHRQDPRHPIDLPLRLGDGAQGVARNISSSGMYIEIRGRKPQEPTILVEMDVPGERMKFRGQGKIVRMDHLDDVTGIAVHLEDAKLELA